MQAAISAASWVVGKALSPIVDGFLEAWAASAGLGTNVHELKRQLLYAQAMLNNTRGRVIDNPALDELLLELRDLGYRADDVLDELEYFRIQDQLHGTHHAAGDVDAAAGGCVQGLVLNARATARAVATKLKLTSGSRHGASIDDSEEEEEEEEEEDNDAGGGGNDDVKQAGCLSGVLSSCGKRAAGSTSSPPLPANDQDGEMVGGSGGGCLPKVVTSARDTVGKLLPCCFSPSVEGPNMPGNEWQFCCGVWQSTARERKTVVETPLLKFDRVEISQKMKDIVDQLKPICAMVSTILNLELLGSARTSTKDIAAMTRPITTSSIIEPKLYGRDDQLNSIIYDITQGKYSDSECITVLPIVGPGGIGKTAFAQQLYQEVKSHFQVSIWICVSLNFNANRLLQEIKEKTPRVDGENTNTSEEEIIEQRLKSKRFLLVLDDVWTCQEDEWKKLLAPLDKGGGKGNMVLVTTRIPEVATMVRKPDRLMELGGLGNADFVGLFEACVFGDQQSWKDHPELFDVGTKIAKKLKGFPLAAKTVGRLLRNQLTVEHWTRVLESKEWEFQTGDNDIMPALKLSYDYLPFHLQQCFSYCALFPEDYEFESSELIHLWIGLDILHPIDQIRIEDVGQSYLDGLVNHAFLKKNERDNGCPYYVVHDLLHELAVKVSSSECISISSSNMWSIQVCPSVRHVSIIIDDKDVDSRSNFEHYKEELKALDKRLKVGNLRTVMLFGKYQYCFVKILGDLFREANAIRIILCESSCSVNNLLPNFSKLVHVRYIRIKASLDWQIGSGVNLPATISRLYQLKILDVQESRIANSLPTDMSNLINLQYFLVSDARVHSTISEVGKLKHLKELTRFEVKKESNGFELNQLGKLLELQVLHIYNLENVEVKDEVAEAKLTQKHSLQELSLNWDIDRVRPAQEENILECLKPHSNLLKLSIRGHAGVECPTWLGVNPSVPNLEHLCLDHVAWKNLPPLGGRLQMLNESGEEYPGQYFKNLKRLYLVNIQNLERWVQNSPSNLFHHLEVLRIEGCQELLELSFSHPNCHQPVEQVGFMDGFPSLRELKIKHCPKLLHVHASFHLPAEQVGNMAWFPSLEKLEIIDCPKLLHVPPIPWASNRCSTEIRRVGSGTNKLNIKYSSLERSLEIEGKDAQDSTFWNVLAFHNLSELEFLKMVECPPLPLDGPQILSYFPKLSNLILRSCERITQLVVVVAEQQVEATTTSLPSSLADIKVDVAQIVYHHQEQQATEGEEERAASAAEGLLLLPPQLQHLGIWNCTELSLHHNDKETGGTGGGLQGLRSLQRLVIWDCPRFFSSYLSPSSGCFPLPASLTYLILTGVETPAPLSNLISLTELYIYRCEGLRVEGIWPCLTEGQLTRLTVQTSPNFFAGSEPSSLHEQQIPTPSSKLQYLKTDDSTGVLAAPICSLLSSSLTRLEIWEDEIVERFSKELENALQRLTNLQDLTFMSCTKLECLPAGLHRLASLKTLNISYCPAIRSLPKDGLPGSLQELNISNCSAIESLLPKDGLPLPSSLQVLSIAGCPAIRSLWPKDGLPSSLQVLSINSCPAIRSLPKDGLPSSLQVLRISSCPAIQSLPKDGLPSSLQVLSIGGCPAIRSLPKDGLPSSLQVLEIRSCPAIRSLPNDGLPSSLQVLEIRSCPAIRSLPNDGLPSSLQVLRISWCPGIRSLPKDGLPSSLQVLEIRQCPAIRSLPKVERLPSSLREIDVKYSESDELRKQCRKLKGVIPIVRA